MIRPLLIASFAFMLPLGAFAAPNTDGLARMENGSFDQVYVRDGWTMPNDLSLASVNLNVGTPLQESIMGTRDLERLRSTFEDDLRDATVADGTVSLEVTLTELIPNRVLAGRSSRYQGYHESFGIGGAAMEAVFRDASTGEVLMVIVDRRRGRSLNQNFHMQSRRVWGDADDILEDWASELPQGL